MTIETRRKGSKWVQNMIRLLLENPPKAKPMSISEELIKQNVIKLSKQGHQISSIAFLTGLDSNRINYILRCERNKEKSPHVNLGLTQGHNELF